MTGRNKLFFLVRATRGEPGHVWCYTGQVNDQTLTLYRSRGIEGVLDTDVERLLTAMPPPACLARPAVLVVGPACSDLLRLAASDSLLAAIAVVGTVDAWSVDPQIDDVVTPRADLDELLMRGHRALARKRAGAEGPSMPQVDIEGARWRGVSVPLSSTEARIAARLLRDPGVVVPEAELRSLDDSGIPMTRRALDTHIYRLRRKLQPISCVAIQSVRQRGFRAVVLPML